MEFLISVVGVLLFAGLTAYDTQKVKSIYYAGDSREVAGRKSIMGPHPVSGFHQYVLIYGPAAW